MSKKIIFYLKGVQRAIAITDPHDEQSLEDCSKLFENALQTNNVFTASNGRDILILKPLDVAAIHITQLEKHSDAHNYQYEPIKDLISDENVTDITNDDNMSTNNSQYNANILDLSELLDNFNENEEENDTTDEYDGNSHDIENNQNTHNSVNDENQKTPNQTYLNTTELDTTGLDINIHDEIDDEDDTNDNETEQITYNTKNEKIHTIQNDTNELQPKVLKVDTTKEIPKDKKKNIKKE